MTDPQSVALGAGALCAILVHMVVTYLFARLQAERGTVSASEADVTSE